MNYTIIIVSFAIVGIVGLICGMGLGVASEKFKVEVDEKELAVREALPGNNCGACGFPGCDGCAHAIAIGEAAVTQCPVGGKPGRTEDCGHHGCPGGRGGQEGRNGPLLRYL